jgi:predicted DNA-binding transcriptional regulator AlpA
MKPSKAARPAVSQPRFLTEKEVSEITGISVKTLQRWRLMGDQGPRYRKLGGAVKYEIRDLEIFIQSAPSGGQVIEPAVA